MLLVPITTGPYYIFYENLFRDIHEVMKYMVNVLRFKGEGDLSGAGGRGGGMSERRFRFCGGSCFINEAYFIHK